MDYEGRVKKRKKKRYTQRFMIISIFLYIFLNWTSTIFSQSHRVLLAEPYIYNIGVKSECIVIKDEEVINIAGKINSNLITTEGERVAVGTEVLRLDSASGINHLEKKLDEVNDTIETLRSINKTNGEGSLSESSLANLEKKKTDLLNQINSSSKAYFAKKSGIVSYKIDGYEGVFLPNDFENYSYERITEFLENQDKEIVEDFNGFKIINNLQWYMALKIDNPDDIKSYKINNKITIEVADINKKIVGNIIEINSSKKGIVIIVMFNSQLHDFYEDRFFTVNIIKSRKEGFKIPTKSIIEYEDNQGVLVKGFNGIVRFKPIKVLGVENEYTIIDKGDTNNYIDLGSEIGKVKTISRFDEIFLNPSKIKEGEILD